MAKQNTYSYSWFKKRTAYVNKMLSVGEKPRYYQSGPKKGQKIGMYSPDVEYKAYHKQAALGKTTTFVERYAADPRSEKGMLSLNVELKAMSIANWDNFMRANYHAALLGSIMNEKDYVIQPNTLQVYKVVKGERGGKHYYAVDNHGRVSSMESRVSNVVEPTPANVNKALAKKAASIKVKKEDRKHEEFWTYYEE